MRAEMTRKEDNEVFSKWSRTFTEFRESEESGNWVQYKDLLCYKCPCGTVVESLSLIGDPGFQSCNLLFDLSFFQ